MVREKKTSDEDMALFRKTVGKVKSIKNDRLHFHKTAKPAIISKPPNADYYQTFNDTPNDTVDLLGDADNLEFLAPGLQKNILKKMRKGFFGIDAELDLHGLTRAEAKNHLTQFLHDCILEHCRCIHIIHGKGYRSPNQKPILKNSLNQWLRQHVHVLAFCSAPRHAGGTGAVYVLLSLMDKHSQ
ncbi:MAG: Smr/MutS family protein [Methylococcales bacterium]|jgi:DNA-nicking Smr family endonuclease|nr:Smr/MutS family protein [Methylococcales bacterium]